ncbi:hypothetical protein KY290_035528 [Solanum tuberosum]|uniref:Ubiquitin-like protease family profile domain-containing protein n=1 Tax=Solanum tuberosum TaxID=4113 RepID=A0ABQ7U6P8_SOLTU|nr:hypothetical protein KY289_034752 [Solanum tuberosum]KAH0647848.1 hypothetical protein KY285_033096 [Solanum tuberosum]KAH0742485.1 hypothetical protein KY290_035528 [Solanum tuberosum]
MDAQSPSKRFTRDDNAKRKEVIVSGSLEHDENLSPTPMELKILELPPEYVRLDQSSTEISAANDSDDNFQDPPRPKNNKGKEKVDTCSSPPKKKSRQTVTPIQKKTPPMIISKHPLRKSPRHANVPKRPKSPFSKRQAKQRANVTSSTCIKQNVEIKSSVASEIPSTNKSPDFSISRDEFEQFKISKVARVAIPSFNSEVSIHQSHLQSPTGHSGFSPLGQQFNTPEPQDLLNVICDQTEKMEKKEFTDTNKSGSSDANKLIVEQVFMCPTPLQMVHDDQSNLNLERSMVLHPLLAVDEHTPLPIPRKRRPGPFNTSPYVTSFRSKSSSSSRFPFTFDLKHPFVSMSDVDLTTLYMHFWKWLNEGLLVKHNTKTKKSDTKRERLSYKCGFILEMSLSKIRIGSISLHTKINCLMTRCHFVLHTQTKYSDNNTFSFITVDCNFNNLIHNIWDAYYNFESNINKDNTEESILEYINGYRMHVAAPWHTVDNILIHVNVKEIFHWIFIIVSLNDRCIHIYDSLSGGALHDSKVESEIKKYAQLIPMYLSKSGFYEKKDIDMSSHPKYKSHSEFDSFEIIYVKDIPQQTEGSLDCGLYVAAYADHISNRNGVLNSFDSEFTHIRYAALLWNYEMQKIQADVTSDSEAPERPIRIDRDCDSSEKITIN